MVNPEEEFTYSLIGISIMLANYIKVAVRNVKKNKGHSLINIGGLALGVACCILLFLWLQDELTYDRFHEKSERIFRVVSQYDSDGQIVRSATTSAPLGPALVSEFPSVSKFVRLGKNGFIVNYEDKSFLESVLFADPDIFDVFDFPLSRGESVTALETPYSILISETIRAKYFGGEDPLGKRINLKGLGDFTITGIFKNIPKNSHFSFDFLGTFTDYAGQHLTNWKIYNYYTYILLPEDASIHDLSEKLPRFVEKYEGNEAVSQYKFKYVPQPITRIHLYSHLKNEIKPNGDIRNIFIFSAIAFLVLLIACFNYINLSISMFINRMKEIGLRRVFGALRTQLIIQFLCEAFFLSFIALVLAVLLAHLFLPLFNALSGKQLSINFFDHPSIFPALFGIFVVVGFISGFSPALIISCRQPVNTIKGLFKSNTKGNVLRRILVIFQFAISIVFFISTVTILNQLDYIKFKELGFNKENLVMIPIDSKIVLEKYQTIKSEFLSNTSVRAVCATTFFPEQNIWSSNYWREGLQADRNPMIDFIIVDDDFLETFGITLLQGRNFSKNFPGDLENIFLLNEAAVKEFGWQSPVGKRFKLGHTKEGLVIGVVANFHFRSLHHEIKPIALYFSPQWFSYFAVRINAQDIPQTLNFLERKWQEVVPNQAFRYSFLDEDIDKLYKTESRLGNIFLAVTFLAILIACFGIFALTAFTTRQRTKEIGIRKVLGGSVPRIVLLLSEELTNCVLAANIIAWPIAWYVMNSWLKNFAYRADFEIWMFLLGGLGTFIIAFLTISYNAINAAFANPIQSLRFE